MASKGSGKAFRNMPGVVGLESCQGVRPHGEVGKVKGRNCLRKSRGAGGYDAQSSGARNKSQVGQFGKARRRFVGNSRCAEETDPHFVYGVRSEGLIVADYKLLGAGWGD